MEAKSKDESNSKSGKDGMRVPTKYHVMDLFRCPPEVLMLDVEERKKFAKSLIRTTGPEGFAQNENAFRSPITPLQESTEYLIRDPSTKLTSSHLLAGIDRDTDPPSLYGCSVDFDYLRICDSSNLYLALPASFRWTCAFSDAPSPAKTGMAPNLAVHYRSRLT